MLKRAESPLIMIGGGAWRAAKSLTRIAEQLGAIVVASTAGKGIVADDHALSLSASTVRPEVLRLLPEADVILAVGTELSETDSFVERMDLNGKLIRVDIDATKISDFYPAEIGIIADAAPTMARLDEALAGHESPGRAAAENRVARVRDEIRQHLSRSEQQHAEVLAALSQVAPNDLIWSGDACQLVYTGAFAMPVRKPRKWFLPRRLLCARKRAA